MTSCTTCRNRESVTWLYITGPETEITGQCKHAAPGYRFPRLAEMETCPLFEARPGVWTQPTLFEVPA